MILAEREYKIELIVSSCWNKAFSPSKQARHGVTVGHEKHWFKFIIFLCPQLKNQSFNSRFWHLKDQAWLIITRHAPWIGKARETMYKRFKLFKQKCELVFDGTVEKVPEGKRVIFLLHWISDKGLVIYDTATRSNVKVLHWYSAFSIWIYSNALYNTLWRTEPDCFMAQFTIFFNVTSRIHRCPQNRMSDVIPQHLELHALLFTE